MKSTSRRTGFTLIELLTVIAIITLLIGILTPALGRARDEAKKAAIKAQLNSIATGCEMFLNDESKYPFSNAAEYSGFDPARDWEVGAGGGDQLQGANLIVDAMVGRDFNGYDPKATTTTPQYDRWEGNNARRKPYIDPGGIDSSSVQKPAEDAYGKFSPPDDNEATPVVDSSYCPIFKDKFGWPVLYYRANPSSSQRSRILPTGWDTNNVPTNVTAVYNGRDNRVFTEHNDGTTGPGHEHELNDPVNNQGASEPLTGPDGPGSGQNDLGNAFADFIRSFRSSTRVPNTTDQWDILRPVNADKFILLTPGKDGIFGNLDDVGNFAVKSEER
jgi:prepilin-type N-terminal cleavage/methylation domain-containing protein